MPSTESQTTAAATFATPADMEAHVGKELGASGWVAVTQERINAFADATEDHQWIHVNPEAAEEHSPFGTTIAHGFLVLSLLPRFFEEIYRVESTTMGVNYGMNRVRFTSPVPSGSRLRGRATLSGYEAIEGGARLTLDVTVEREGQVKPACVAEFIALVYG